VNDTERQLWEAVMASEKIVDDLCSQTRDCLVAGGPVVAGEVREGREAREAGVVVSSFYSKLQ